MKKFYFLFLLPIFLICIGTKLESRQYNIDYLLDLIEAGDEEGVLQFFTQPNYVTKMKHVIEFAEQLRSKIEERFGYKPSYREAYEKFKAVAAEVNLSKEQEELFHSMFKEIIKASEKSERKGLHIEKITMDFKGTIDDSDNGIPDPLVIAYNEGLGGCLMCIIPGGLTQLIGSGMIIDAARRTYDYLENKSSHNEPHDCSDHGRDREDNSDRGRDRDSWDKEY